MAFSYIDYSGNGTNTDFAFPFPYISRTHVSCFVNSVTVPFSWLNDGTVRFLTAPEMGGAIRIKRVTPRTPLVTWNQGATMKAGDLNKANLQALYLIQEILDGVGNGEVTPSDPTLSFNVEANSFYIPIISGL